MTIFIDPSLTSTGYFIPRYKMDTPDVLGSIQTDSDDDIENRLLDLYEQLAPVLVENDVSHAVIEVNTGAYARNIHRVILYQLAVGCIIGICHGLNIMVELVEASKWKNRESEKDTVARVKLKYGINGNKDALTAVALWEWYCNRED